MQLVLWIQWHDDKCKWNKDFPRPESNWLMKIEIILERMPEHFVFVNHTSFPRTMNQTIVLAWVANSMKLFLEENCFLESIQDISPIAHAVEAVYLQIWNVVYL